MKHFLEVGNLSKAEFEYVLQLSSYLHETSEEPLHQKTILFCFEKPSLRTRVGTEVAINQLGGKVIHIDPIAFLGGKILHAKPIEGHDERESLKDTVLNVSQWCDAIFVRVFDHHTLLKLCQHSEIPIINALSDTHHPMQALADFLTIKQKYGEEKVPISFIGDANNVAKSLIEAGIMLGYPMGFSGPEEYGWSNEILQKFNNLCEEYEGSFTSYSSAKEAATHSRVLYADTFVSMGEEDVYDEKLKSFSDFQINESLMSLCLNDAAFMHCLPAHRGIEVTNGVMDSAQSLIYEQAKNRMVVSKGLFSFLIEKKGEIAEESIKQNEILI
ncbi:ornithine carbamoyltransferase [Ekhidna sp.]